MKIGLKWAIGLGVGFAFCGAAFYAGHAWAGGIPSSGAMTYSGVLQDVSGAPLTGTQFVEVKFWNSATESDLTTNLLCDSGTPASVSLEVGHFSIGLPDTCSSQVGLNKNIWAEVIVGPTAVSAASLGRAKLGAVPFAIEANHAVSADSATSATNATNALTANTAAGDLAATIGGLAAKTEVPVITDWGEYPVEVISYTSGKVIKNVHKFGRWRRVGDTAEVRITMRFDGPPVDDVPNPISGTLAWSLPPSVVFDYASYLSPYPLGMLTMGAGSLSYLCQALPTGDGIHVYGYCDSSAISPGTSVCTTGFPVTIDANANASLDLRIPVLGWNSHGP
jgi:hypothetical protein